MLSCSATARVPAEGGLIVNRLRIALVLVVLLGLVTAGAAGSDLNSAPGYVMRYANIGHGHIVFTYEDDLWLVPVGGGNAHRITSNPGLELGAKISPDGTKVAFTGNYDGGMDVYVMDLEGSVPQRLTYHPAADFVADWCPDGKGVVFSSNREAPSFSSELYKVTLDGGMPIKLPVDRGSLASVAPDHSGLAYNRYGRQVRTWKRYQGGNAQDIWVKDLKNGGITRITDWSGSDQFPMWAADGNIYFASDRQDGTLNIYGYNTTSTKVRQLTFFKDYDVKYPSLGGDKIIFQYGPGLSVLDLTNGKVAEVPIHIPSDRRLMRTELVKPQPRAGSFGLSPAGKRVLIEARGEILNLPTADGDPLNLTRTPGSRERNGTWSPDGRWVAMVSDRTGEEQIYLVDQHGRREWRQLTHGNFGFLLQPVWSPDSKSLVFADKFMKLHLVDVDSGDVSTIAQSDYDDAWERWGIQDYVWSPDSRWLAYTTQTENMNEAIWLYDTSSGKNTQLTDEMTEDWSPSFSRDGQYLYFLSSRTFNPIMGRQDQTHVFLKTARPYMVLLRDGARSPFYQKDTEVAVVVDGDKAKQKDEKKDKQKDKATVIDLAGIADRILACEGVDADNYFRLEAVDGGFVMLRKDDPEFLKYQNVDDHTGGALELVGYKLEDKELSDLMSGIANFHLSADGKKLIYRAGAKYGMVDAGKPAEVGDGKVEVGAVNLTVDRRQEFPQIFREAWRIQRDWFYDANMQGTDWPAMYEKYAPFVAGCGTRGDLNYLIGEMISELNIGHTYVYGGDFEDTGARVPTGMLGCGFHADKGKDHYRFADVVAGVSWDTRYRSPLEEPGVGIKAGDYLIAIDGQDVGVDDNVFAHLQDLADKMVILTVSKSDSGEDSREVRLQTLRSERGLRYRAWVDANRAHVNAKSEGKVAYVHMPDMGEKGLVEFGRSYYPQTGKQAMIFDDRYNGGGFVGDMVIDRLERQLWAITQPREGKGGRNPERVFHGPLVVLINGDTYSNGEFFAEAIQRKGLATLIGERTWGGSTGMEPHQNLVDGGATTPPQFGLYGLDGTWPIEGWGVVPDIIVVNAPADVVAGHDAQLDKAIDYLLQQLQDNPGKWTIPPTPPYPVKARPAMSGGRP